MAGYDPFGVYGGASAGTTTASKGTAASNYTGGTSKSNVGRQYDPFKIGSVATPAVSAAPVAAPAPQPAAKPSLFSRVVSGAKALGSAAVTTGEKVANTAAAGVGGIVGIDKVIADKVVGNNKAAASTAGKTSNTINQLLSSGLGGKGGYLTPKQSQSRGGGAKAYVNDFVKPTVAASADVAPYVIPIGGETKGASLLARMAKSGGANAVVGGASVAGSEYANNQKLNVKDITKGAAISGAIGAVAPLAHDLVHSVKGKVADANPLGGTTDAKGLIQNTRVQSLLDKARTIQDAAQAPAKAAEREQASAAKAAETTQVQSEKIDKQVELINAKKADGKFTNVDKVKVQQLLADKQKLQSDNPVVPATGGRSNAPSGSLLSGRDKPPTAAVDTPTSPAAEVKASEAPAAKTAQTESTKSSESVSSANDTPKPVDTAPIKAQIETVKNDTKSYDTNGNVTPEAGKQITALQKQLTAAGERVPKAEKPVTVTPVESKPTVLNPEIKTSKLGQRVEAIGLRKNLTEAFNDKPEFAGVNKKQQIDAATKLYKSDPERLVRIAMGHEKPPEGLLPESAWVAAVHLATKNKDGELLRQLGTKSELVSEASVMGQRISMLSETDRHNAARNMKEIAAARAKAAEAKLGKPINKAVSSEIKQIRATTPKVTKETWSSFVESLKC